jgi:hypothetical protein
VWCICHWLRDGMINIVQGDVFQCKLPTGSLTP